MGYDRMWSCPSLDSKTWVRLPFKDGNISPPSFQPEEAEAPDKFAVAVHDSRSDELFVFSKGADALRFFVSEPSGDHGQEDYPIWVVLFIDGKVVEERVRETKMDSFKLTRKMLLGINIYHNDDENRWMTAEITVDPDDGMVAIGIDSKLDPEIIHFVAVPQPSFEVWSWFPDGSVMFLGNEIARMPVPDWQKLAAGQAERKANAAGA